MESLIEFWHGHHRQILTALALLAVIWIAFYLEGDDDGSGDSSTSE